ncbi:MAG: CHAD domain-containing protein [Cyclobacteriaceae bacterium]
MKTTLSVKNDVSSQIQEILTLQVESCRSALQSNNHHAGIHEARKELKKIRAVLRLARLSVPSNTYKKTNAYFRDIGRLLSEARDTAALLEVVSTLHNQVKQPTLKSLLNTVVHHLSAKKAAVTRYQINRDQLPKKTKYKLTNAEEYITNYELDEEGFDALANGLEKVYARGRNMMKVVIKDPDPENFHEWRKRAKYLRYQLYTIREVWPAMLDVWEGELHQLTDSLGAEHDLFVLHETILNSKLKGDSNWQLLFEFIATRRKTHQQEAIILGKKIYAQKPNQFTNWLEKSWKSIAKAKATY